jgi:transcriptional regulator with XRE-family HTH domain
MVLSERLRLIREQKKMTQGDIEKITGLKRSYVSRLEHGRTVPSLATLEKFAGALQVPLYHFFYEGEKPPDRMSFPPALRNGSGNHFNGNGVPADFLQRMGNCIRRMNEPDRKVLLQFVSQLLRKKTD